MKNTVFNLLIIILIVSSCTSKNEECKIKIETFLETVSESDFKTLYGFSAESTWSKRDINGNRRVPRISYTDVNGENFELSSFQEYDNGKIEPYDMNHIERFSESIDSMQSNALSVTRHYSSLIVQFLNDYDIMGIQSQKHLGNYIEFKVRLDCSIYYKSKEASLATGMNRAFRNAYEIKPNWYIMNDNEESKKLIELYKKS